MKSIEQIVSEQIHRYLVTEAGVPMSSGYIRETETAEAPKNNKSTKTQKWQKASKRAKMRDGVKVSQADADAVRDFLNDPSVNVSDVMEKATGLAPTSASSLGAKIAKGDRPVKSRLAHVVRRIKDEIG